MPRGKTSKPAAGLKIRVNDGVSMPEFPNLPIAGWEGTVLETSGSGSKLKVIVEWDAPTMERIPADYRQHCESQGLVDSMVCLMGSDVQVEEP